MSKLGIDNLKKVAEVAFAFQAEGAKAMEDGRFQLIETLGFTDEFMQLPEAVNAAKLVPAELEDLDETERNELADYIQEKFDIANDEVEAKIEKAVAWLIHTYTFFRDIR